MHMKGGSTVAQVGTVAFTGYRPEKMPFSEDLADPQYLRFRAAEARIIRMLAERGYTHFVTGLARGFDMWTAEDVLALKEEFPAVTLTCAIPFPGQADEWPAAERARYEAILARATDAVVLSETYSKGCFFARNRYMVDMADVVICAYDGRRGGTAYTVDYALTHGKRVIRIDPATGLTGILKLPDTE